MDMDRPRQYLCDHESYDHHSATNRRADASETERGDYSSRCRQGEFPLLLPSPSLSLPLALTPTEQAHSRFSQQVYAAVLRHFDFEQLKVLIIASPGFTKDAVYQYIMEEAVVSPLLPPFLLRRWCKADLVWTKRGQATNRSYKPRASSCSSIPRAIMCIPWRRSCPAPR